MARCCKKTTVELRLKFPLKIESLILAFVVADLRISALPAMAADQLKMLTFSLYLTSQPVQPRRSPSPI